MIDNYEIKLVDNEECLFLYINDDYEFGEEFLLNEKRKKKKSLYNTVVNFIKKNKINFNGKKIFFVFRGIVIGSLVLGSIMSSITPPNNIQYVEYDNSIWQYNIEKKENEKAEISKEENQTKTTVVEQTSPKTTIPQTATSETVTPKAIIPPKTTIPKATAPQTNTTSTPVQEPAQPIAPVTEEKPADTMVTLYRYNGTIEQITLEDYVTGVVAAEMPAAFSVEALKAQAIAARTYALKRVTENKVITDNNANQMYKDNSQLKTMWGASYNTYYTKVKNAVANTEGQYIAYNHYYIDALYFSTSNGKTEDPIYVWGNSFPYLKSVDSHWDTEAITYSRSTTKTLDEVSKILGFDINKDTTIQVVSKTIGDRVNEITIGNNTYSGIDIRDLFGLRSSDFDIEITNTGVNFATRGYGHGVGMSQYGANGMAKEGYTYKQILNHYYPNTEILTK